MTARVSHPQKETPGAGHPLHGIRVLELATGIAGPYLGKMFADAGADVVKIERPAGDPLRAWSASGTQGADGGDSALFRFLNTSKRSVVVTDAESPRITELAAQADLIVLGDGLHHGVPPAGTEPGLDTGTGSGTGTGTGIPELARRLHAAYSQAVVVAITPFGLTANSADATRPMTEFLLQALSGSTAGRGSPEGPPLQAGGRIGEWASGTYAAVAALAALHGAHRDGAGDLVDVSMLDCMTVILGGLSVVGRTVMGRPPAAAGAAAAASRIPELPSIEPTKDGLVGFCTITAQQFQDFLLLIDRPDLLADDDLANLGSRYARREEFLAAVHAWTSTHTSEEIIERAAALRIPVAPIGSPRTVTTIDQFTARGVFGPNPRGGFQQPRTPYRIGDFRGRPPEPAPTLGEHTDSVAWPARRPPVAAAPTTTPAAVPGGGRPLPLSGLRVLDLTAFWAGPSATLLLGSLGADVIKVEGVSRPDGMRFSGGKPPSEPRWWEWGVMFLATNPNKRGISLELTRPEGIDLARRLIAASDVVIENFSPRVLSNLGLDWDVVHAANPAAILTRMPAFGLDGPWRDRTGFAQTMEQASGMAWLTGTADGPPLIPRGACDPIAGLHAAFATLVALAARDRSGTGTGSGSSSGTGTGRGAGGTLVEATMVEAVLNVAAELTIEYTANGAELMRAGNRGPLAAPQGVYRCAGPDGWVALAILDDPAWIGLCTLIGRPDLARDPELVTSHGRRQASAHDRIDAAITTWTAARDRDTAAAELVAAGVPAAPVVPPADLLDSSLHADRGFFERLRHPVVGEHPMPGVAFRLASHPGPLLRRPAPTFGQHDDEVYGDLLGLSASEINVLRESGLVADRPAGV
ncbi:Crotonobetainyl-CoA:carnitine CoA-transferase CaiB [Parafrankia irregularis]|uniref:Crotonobetainyl-CoA:carnitine CoA-transferase CaiB n=1 Tax=Parafrankia irregularis TaxID=795642 RepID=A0A0S4QL60_9ACTN|nr:Crotonobetainyl-CoA:carnitine CoA-transferase CaiB [Parafrankia irregularis]